MTAGVSRSSATSGSMRSPGAAWARVGAIAFFGVLPALTVCHRLRRARSRRTTSRSTSGSSTRPPTAILRGESPYLESGDPLTAWGGPYPYPPLLASSRSPLTALSLAGAGLSSWPCSSLVALAVPWVLGVRDWRCYGVLLLWPPVISAIQTGNVTLAFALAAAVGWRFRDSSLSRPPLHRRHAGGEVLPLAARGLARGDAESAQRRVGSRGRGRAAPRVVGGDRLRGPRRLPVTPAQAAGRGRGPTRTRPTSSGSISACPRGVARAVWLAVGLAALAGVVVSGATRGRAGPRSSSRSRRRSRSLRSCGCTTSRFSSWSSRLRGRRLGVIWFVPLAHGRHAGERASDAVPDRVDAGRRSRHGRAGRARVARTAPRASSSRPRSESVTTSTVADVRRPARVDRGHVGCRETRVGARRLGRDGGMERRASSDRAAQLRELPRRPLRPREHGSGGLEHGPRPSARDHARRRRATRSFGSAGMSIRSSRSSRRCGSCGPRRWRSRFAQVVVVALGALPVFWLGRRHLDSEAAAALLAIGYLAYPWTATSAAASIHPVTFAIPLFLFCIWFLDTERLGLVHGLRAARDVDGRAHGAADRGPRHLVRLRPRDGAAPEPSSPLSAWRGRSSAVYVIVPHFSGGNSIFYGFYDDVGGSPVGALKSSSPTRARSSLR